MYRSLCRLTEENWERWKISEDLKIILSASRKFREERKVWKSKAHQNRNWNRNPEENPDNPSCQACAHLDDGEKCVQYRTVHESDLVNSIRDKLVIPEENDVLRPLV